MLQAAATDIALPSFELTGPPGAPVIITLGGISAHAHVCANSASSERGWWESIVGRQRAIDTSRFRVLSFNWLDGGEAQDGRPARLISTHDQAECLATILEHLEIEEVHAIVGASYGGMVALAFAEARHAEVERLVVISAAHRTHPMTTAIRSVQRRIVELGLESGNVSEALGLARQLAMTTYRSREEFARRFDVFPSKKTSRDAAFPVESYLEHHGQQFAGKWTASRFLALSLSADLHVVDPPLITTSTTLVAAQHDSIVPRADLEKLQSLLGGESSIVDLPTIYGHDAFLTEHTRLSAILSRAIES